jgi:2-oxoglutarate ferredoxin oxidoreductase subunit alpha
MLLTGNEAVAEAAIDVGCRFYAGYPITPSTEIAESLAAKLPRLGGKFIQMEDEIASLSAVIGAALTGAKALTATSGPGFSLKQEAIGYACEAEIPCVIANVMRGGPSTGLPTHPAQGDVMQARWGTHGDHPIVAYCPESVQETYLLTVKSFNVSELLRNPVILLLDEIVGHVTEKVRLPFVEDLTIINRKTPSEPPSEYLPYRITEDLVPPLAAFGSGYRFHVTGLLHQESGFPSNDSAVAEALMLRLMAKVDYHLAQIEDNEEYLLEDADLILFAYGAVARSARSAVKRARAEGRRWGLFRPRCIWPFPEKRLFELAQGRKGIVCAEMNLGQLAGEVKKSVEGRVPVHSLGRVGGLAIHPDEIYDFALGRC